jgi:hypothetical protein
MSSLVAVCFEIAETVSEEFVNGRSIGLMALARVDSHEDGIVGIVGYPGVHLAAVQVQEVAADNVLNGEPIRHVEVCGSCWTLRSHDSREGEPRK